MSQKPNAFSIHPGVKVSYQGKLWIIKKVTSLSTCLLQSHAKESFETIYVEAPIPALLPDNGENSENKVVNERELQDIPQKYWELAKKRYNLIQPILNDNVTTEDLKIHAEINKVHIATLYRWLNRFKRTNTLSSLLPDPERGGKGKTRLNEELEAIITNTIETEYLTSQKKSIKRVYEAVQRKCKVSSIDPPHESTIRLRIKSLSAERILSSRYGKKAAKEKFSPMIGHFNEAKFPLSVVQIDHTKLDIILVDEVYRKPILRPWITVAIDVYSRMIVGIYISFDPPGALAVGMCLANAILPKEMWLNKIGVSGEWPSWGVMRTIHADNGKDFRGDMLQLAAEEYNINIQWRPVKLPHWGGHIERLIGTIVREIHSLPGSTFSNIGERKNYNSEKKAALTLPEFEKWIVTFIVNVYHKRIHKGIGTTPILKYTEGIFGSDKMHGVGLPEKLLDERRVKLDFMPFEKRSIQEYGVKIDHINYYHEVLKKWIHALEHNYKKEKRKREFIFKRDPRDISVIYFFDPELKQYFDIPYRDTSNPPITIWEYNEVVSRQTSQGLKIKSEADIFEGYKAMQAIAENAILQKSKVRISKKNVKKQYSQSKSLKAELQEKSIDERALIPIEETTNEPNYNNKIKPFEDLDYGIYS